jgi:D-alanyl-D-alanine carboxypeptidase
MAIRPARLAILVLLAFLAPALASSQQKLSAQTQSAIDAIAEQALHRGPIAGMSIAIARGSNILVAKGYGYADLENDVAASADTVYHLDSVTKNLTAAAVLLLAEQGKLSLDDEIAKYVAEFPAQGHRVLIRNLLSHTSGIVNFSSIGAKFDAIERLDSSHQMILGIIQNEPFHFAPGDGWRYSNTGFYLLGMIIERVSGQRYGDFMATHLFKALDMRSTRYCESNAIIKHPAHGYTVGTDGFANADFISWVNVYSAGAICSTVLDLVKYQLALNRGQLVNEAFLAAMRTPTQLTDGTFIDYGMGTRLGSLAGHRIVGHTGNGAGFNHVLEYFPADDLIVAVLMNTDGHLSALTVATQIAQLLLNLPKEEPMDLPLTAKQTVDFSGSFESDEQTTLVFEKNGKLWAKRLGSKGDGFPAAYVGDDTFVPREFMRVRFLYSQGKVGWNATYLGGMFMDASRKVQ